MKLEAYDSKLVTQKVADFMTALKTFVDPSTVNVYSLLDAAEQYLKEMPRRTIKSVEEELKKLNLLPRDYPDTSLTFCSTKVRPVGSSCAKVKDGKES